MQIISDNNKLYISAKELYTLLGIKRQYSQWIKESIERAGLEIDKDFLTKMLQSTGGRPTIEYLLNKDSAISIVVMSGGKLAKDLRKEIISIFSKRQSLELITVKEAAFAVKVINCLKFIDNQKEAYVLHQKSFVEENNNTIDPRFIYSEFAKYRAKITGWDKERTDKAIADYLMNHSGYNRNKVMSANMQIKMSVMDIGEAIRIAVLDILYSKHEDSKLAENFSILCKNLAKEMQIEPDKENSKNLFKDKEEIDNIRLISLI